MERNVVPTNPVIRDELNRLYDFERDLVDEYADKYGIEKDILYRFSQHIRRETAESQKNIDKLSL